MEKQEINPRDMRIFVAVFEEQGFSRASAKLGTVQSNVSTHIRTLEKFLGVPLFERRYRQAVPTESGEQLYSHAKQVLAALDRALQACRRKNPPEERHQ